MICLLVHLLISLTTLLAFTPPTYHNAVCVKEVDINLQYACCKPL